MQLSSFSVINMTVQRENSKVNVWLSGSALLLFVEDWFESQSRRNTSRWGGKEAWVGPGSNFFEILQNAKVWTFEDYWKVLKSFSQCLTSLKYAVRTGFHEMRDVQHTHTCKHTLVPTYTHTLTHTLVLAHTHSHTLALAHPHTLLYSHTHTLRVIADRTGPEASKYFTRSQP